MIYNLPLALTQPVDGWTVKRLDELAEVVGGGTPDTDVPEFWQPPEIPWATPTDITACEGITISSTQRSISQRGLENCSAKILPVNSCLMTSRATIGECRLNALPMATNQGFASLIPKDGIDPRFLFYLVHHIKPAVVRLAAGTTYVEVSRTAVRRIRCRVPEQPEQEAIAGVLTQTEAALTESKRKLVAARRLKTALLQQLFTHGLPGRHTQFQETKIGRIPAEWEVVPLRQLATVDSGVTLNQERSPRSNPKQYLTVVNVQRERLDLTEVRFLEMWPSEIPAMLLQMGDILVVEGHANSHEIGRAAIVTPEAAGMTFQNHLFRVRLLDGVNFNRRFLLGWLNSEPVRRHWNATANTSSGLNTINRRGLRRLLIPKPRSDEQEEIAGLLEAADANIEAIEREVEALRRLKRSLLQNLLTGKVRVKGEVTV